MVFGLVTRLLYITQSNIYLHNLQIANQNYYVSCTVPLLYYFLKYDEMTSDDFYFLKKVRH